MTGWILYKRKIDDSYETQRLVEEFEKQDIKVRVVNPQDVDIYVDRDDRKSIRVGGKARALPDFVIPRTGSGTTYFIKAIIRHLERLGVILINGSESIDAVKDKLYSQQILGQSNLPVPKTLLVKPSTTRLRLQAPDIFASSGIHSSLNSWVKNFPFF